MTIYPFNSSKQNSGSSKLFEPLFFALYFYTMTYSYFQYMRNVGNCHKPLFHLTCDDSNPNYYNWLRKLHSKGTKPRQAARILERAYSMFIESSKFLFI